SCSEGSPAPTLSTTTAAVRADGGCVDNDNNSADLTVVVPAPRNSASPAHSCAPPPNTPPSTPTATPTNVTPLPAVLISEFRTRGPSGANDEFVELYNPGVSPVD